MTSILSVLLCQCVSNNLLLKKISINSFRNLEDQEIIFYPSVNLILGENGQGKTSILEAIYLLSQGKSFREFKNRNLTQWSKESFEVSGDFQSVEGSKNLSFVYENLKKIVKINNNKINSAEEFFGNFTCICFTPDDLELVKAGSIVRRKFVDQNLAMISSKYVHSLVTYQRALKNRNLILNSNFSRAELKPWEKLLAEYGLIIAEIRAEFIKGISEYFNSSYEKISNQETAEIKYSSELLRNGKLLEKEELEEIYTESLIGDLRNRSTRIGIHRDKIEFFLDFDSKKVSARNNASQGQARSLALAAKIAAAKFVSVKKQEPPVLLLDDVQSELDQFRLNRLFELLFSLEGQVIITATEKEKLPIFSANKTNEFLIKKGRLSS